MIYVRTIAMSMEDFYIQTKGMTFIGWVSYTSGGWYDRYPTIVLPHISFTNEEDALLYILKKGGKIYHERPTKRLAGESEYS